MKALECQAKVLGGNREPLQVLEQGHCVVGIALRKTNVALGGGGSWEAFWKWGAGRGAVLAEQGRNS